MPPIAKAAAPETGRRADDLERENEKLRKIVKVLVDRVERSTDAQGNAFSLFQAAITLETTVRQRTSELQLLNGKLQQEIEERRAIESALDAAKRQAERANASKTEFLSAASHDLLQPISIARLFVDSLAELEHDERGSAMLDRIDRSLEAAEGLLSTLLEMSRIDGGALRPEIRDVAIDPLLKRLSDDYAAQAEARALRLRVVPCDAVVETDVRLLERILRNFLSNALRYTERGGVLVACRKRGGSLRIEVWDTGRGIPGDRLGDIFKDFLRLESDGGTPGMGLGLAIVDRLSRLLGARVSVRSREGRGSVFRIEIPLGDADRARNEPARPERTAGVLSGKTLLLVEKPGTNGASLAAPLRRWGLRTIALAALEGSEVPPFDAILVDDDGRRAGTEDELVAALRTRFGAAVPAIVVSSESRERRFAGNGAWYLNRPLRIDRLRSLLHHLLQA